MISEADLQAQVADYLRCSVGGCNKPAKSRGYCAKHYTRFIARIKADGKEISKSFDSLSDAVEFRAKMEEKYARA